MLQEEGGENQVRKMPITDNCFILSDLRGTKFTKWLSLHWHHTGSTGPQFSQVLVHLLSASTRGIVAPPGCRSTKQSNRCIVCLQCMVVVRGPGGTGGGGGGETRRAPTTTYYY